MPELPEVEIVCRGLNDAFVGHRLTKVIRRFAQLRWPIPDDLEASILGVSAGAGPGNEGGSAGGDEAGSRAGDEAGSEVRTDLRSEVRSEVRTEVRSDAGVLRSVQRRSKYLLLGFDTGTLLIHLGMSGTLRRLTAAEPTRAHDHVDFVFGEQVLRFNDPRRFGAILWYPDSDGPGNGHHLLRRLGVEPFSEAFSGPLMFEATRGRSASIKQVLLTGAIVVGVGNIYASESLFRAGIRPTMAAGRISRPRYERLAGSIRQTLTDAIAAGGSTLRDFVASTGQSGYFQLQCFVYGRGGEPCRVCGTSIRAIRQQQRASFFCPSCQKA